MIIVIIRFYSEQLKRIDRLDLFVVAVCVFALVTNHKILDAVSLLIRSIIHLKTYAYNYIDWLLHGLFEMTLRNAFIFGPFN